MREILADNTCYRATKYVSPTLVVRATRSRLRDKIDKKWMQVTLSICKPNYIDRELIKECKKAGEPFPVKKIQLKFVKK